MISQFANRFFTAWSESGEIYFRFVVKSIQSAAESCLGPEMAASLFAICPSLFKIQSAAKKLKEVVNDVQDEVDNLRDQGQDSTAGQMFCLGTILMEFHDEIQEAREICAGKRDGQDADEEEEKEAKEEAEKEDGGDGGDEERPSLFEAGLDQAPDMADAALAGGAVAVGYIGDKVLQKKPKHATENLSAVEESPYAVDISGTPLVSLVFEHSIQPDSTLGSEIDRSVVESTCFVYEGVRQTNANLVKRSLIGSPTRSAASLGSFNSFTRSAVPPVPLGAIARRPSTESALSAQSFRGFNAQDNF